MKTYLKSLTSTLAVVILALVVATISDTNDLFDLEIILFLMLIPAIIISSLFFGLYRKKYLLSIVSLLLCVVYFYSLMKVSLGIDPFGILIYIGFIYLPLIVLGSVSSSLWRIYKIKKEIY